MPRTAEFRTILDGCHSAWARGAATVLAVVTSVEGSAYRRPGAVMLLTDDSHMVGSISSGCLEADLYLHAERIARGDRGVQVHYDLGLETVWSLGVGCHGAIDVALLPLLPTDPFWLNFHQLLASDHRVAWLQELPDGQRGLLTDDGRRLGDALPEGVWARAQRGVDQAEPASTFTVGSQAFLLDVLLPAPHLVISGTGADATAIARLAETVGFSSRLLNPPGLSNQVERPPTPGPSALSATNGCHPAGSFWLIMNHQQARDQAAMALALTTSPHWVGVMGPRGRTETLLANLGLCMEAGPIVSPVGLDLGAETVEEVALSIVSQLLGVERQKPCTPLHGRAHIH